MNGRIAALGAVGVAAIGLVAVMATGGSDSPADEETAADFVAQSETSASTSPAPAATSAPTASPPTTLATAVESAPQPAAAACTSTQQPHLEARGVVTSIDGVPIATQGEYEGIWFSIGNNVTVTVPEAGGPAYVWLVALISTDAGQSQSYQVGHDSRGAYAPPDPRAPENYLAFVADSAKVEGTVGMSIDSLEAGEVPTMAPAAYQQSVFAADYDAAAGTIAGTVQHPDLVVEFYADDIVTKDQPVFSSPECFQQAVQQARAQHNP